MKTLLQIHTSLNGSDSLSSSLAGEYVARWRRENPGGHVIERDLARDPVPHLSAATFAAFLAGDDERGPMQAAAVARSDELVRELKVADEIVMAVPMYNFGIPSTLKSYFDHIARAGVTFRYTDNGPVGLLSGKRALLVATRGGRYAGTPLDTQTQYLKTFLSFVGIDDTRFVYAEGTAMGEDDLSAALAAARSRIAALPTMAT